MAIRISGRILVVDDDEDLRDVCVEILCASGYTVETASGGLEALEKISGGDWDLVLSDFNMPDMDGITLYKSSIRESPGMKNRFIFMTGAYESMDNIKSLSMTCIKKPFRVKDLLVHIDMSMAKALEESYGGDCARRRDERFAMESECGVSGEDKSELFAAMVADISRNGMKIRYSGDQLNPDSEGFFVNIRCWNMLRKARVVWSRQENGGHVTGMLFNEPIPAASIISVINQRYSQIQ